ncbi:MAG TPA: S41 family peptidase [Gemmatimonas sp.]|nr:S41 family peptidase [Gemmatimonas sp.]
MRHFVLRFAAVLVAAPAISMLAVTSAAAQTISRTIATTQPGPLAADSVETLRNALLPSPASRGDLATLDRAYRLYHPGLARYQTLAEWGARVDSLDRWFAVPRSRGETYLALSELVATIKDSHTYLNFWNQPKATRAWLSDGADKLPFTFTLDAGDRWVVTRSAAFTNGDVGDGDGDDDGRGPLLVMTGDTIVVINGTPTPALTQRMIAATRADGGNDGKRRALIGFRHDHERETSDVLLPLLAPPVRGRYTLTVRRGRDTVIDVRASSAEQRNSVALPVAAPRPPFTVTQQGGVTVLTVDGFALSSAEGAAATWSTFLRETFLGLQQRGATSLVLDLRRNEGGSDDAAALLLSYLITKPTVVPALRRYVIYDTVETALRPALQTWDKAFYDRRGSVRREPDGTFTLLDRGAWPDSILPSPLAFRGRIAILTSPVNSSASHLMLRVLPRRPNITRIGTETGGSLFAHTGGNLFFLALRGTGLEADIPLIAYQWDDRNPRTGLPPDVPTGIDDAMTRALELLGPVRGQESGSTENVPPDTQAFHPARRPDPLS